MSLQVIGGEAPQRYRQGVSMAATRYRVHREEHGDGYPWLCDFPSDSSYRDVYGDGIACETWEDAHEVLRAALRGADELQTAVGPGWVTA